MIKWAKHPRARNLLAFLAIVAAIATLVARLSRVSRDGRRNVLTWAKSHPLPSEPQPANSSSPKDNYATVLPTPTPTPTPAPLPSNAPSLDNPQNALGLATSPAELIIPVAGVRPDQLRDTFSEARAEGRVHDAIDIPAPQGTPVLAAADGRVIKLSHSDRGGTTIYQLNTDSRFVYYYAHLDRYADGLTEGHFAKQGETIAYVGDTGNAGAGNYHLHFSIALISDPRRYWEGMNINPYPLLRK